jgi:HSP20 family protein
MLMKHSPPMYRMEDIMALRELVPWRWGGLRRWEEEDQPLHAFRTEMESLHREMDRLFEDLWRGAGRPSTLPEAMHLGDVYPRVDETEDDKAYHVAVELPGMDEKDVEVTLTDGLLTIRGEKKQVEEEKGKDFYRKERSFGSFRRALPIPGEVDESKIKASYKKGVLIVDLPKSEAAQKKVRHIDVKAA